MTLRRVGTGSVPPRLSTSELRSYPAWAQQHDQNPAGADPGSHPFYRTNHRHDAAENGKSHSRPRGEAELPLAQKPASIQQNTRGVCKDAAAQTDTALERGPGTQQPSKPDEPSLTMDLPLESSRNNNLLAPPGSMHKLAPSSVPGWMQDPMVPAPEELKYAEPAVGSVHRRHLGERVGCNGHGGNPPGVEQIFGGRAIRGVAPYTYTEEAALSARYTASDARLLSRSQVPSTEHWSWATPQNVQGKDHETENGSGVSGNLSSENIEDFIRRIEDETVWPNEHVERSRAALNDECGDLLSSRDWITMETALSVPYITDISWPLSRGFSVDGWDALGELEPQRSAGEHSGYLTSLWEQRNTL